MDDATPKLPSRTVLLAEMLAEMLRLLEQAGDAAAVREVRLRVLTYQRVVSSWDFTPPTSERADAMFDQVQALHSEITRMRRRVAGAGPT